MTWYKFVPFPLMAVRFSGLRPLRTRFLCFLPVSSHRGDGGLCLCGPARLRGLHDPRDQRGGFGDWTQLGRSIVNYTQHSHWLVALVAIVHLCMFVWFASLGGTPWAKCVKERVTSCHWPTFHTFARVPCCFRPPFGASPRQDYHRVHASSSRSDHHLRTDAASSYGPNAQDVLADHLHSCLLQEKVMTHYETIFPDWGLDVRLNHHRWLNYYEFHLCHKDWLDDSRRLWGLAKMRSSKFWSTFTCKDVTPATRPAEDSTTFLLTLHDAKSAEAADKVPRRW